VSDEHPQPAFDLLTSLPIPAEDSFLVDWDGVRPEKIDDNRGASIRDHPEIWGFYELPDCLTELTIEDYVSFHITPWINLNALAIGLGLENIEYKPEKFPGLVYHPEEMNATALCAGGPRDEDKSIFIAVSENPSSARRPVVKTINKTEELELIGISRGWQEGIETKQVAELV